MATGRAALWATLSLGAFLAIYVPAFFGFPWLFLAFCIAVAIGAVWWMIFISLRVLG